MSFDTLATLRRMANDIARNLEAMGHDKAVLATADHIDKFWDPRMKKAIFADDERFGVLTPIAAEAIDHLAGVGMADLVRGIELGAARLRFRVRAAGEVVDRFGGDRDEHAEPLVVGEDRALHARVPELVDVVGGCQHRLVVAHRGEVARDIVGHAAQRLDRRAHSAGSIAVPSMRRERSLSSA